MSLSKEVRIYPKDNQESEAQHFLESYDDIQKYIKSNSISIHLNDVDNLLIPTVDDSNQSTELLDKSITEHLYRQLKSIKLLDFRETFSHIEPWIYYPAMYKFLQNRMPQTVKLNVLSGHPDIRNLMTAWNSNNKSLPINELTLDDDRVEKYILSQFGITYQHFSIPVQQTIETYEQIHYRMHNTMAQTREIDKLKETAHSKMAKKITEHQLAITTLNNLFSLILGDIPTEVSQLVENRQYAKVYNKYLHFHLVVKDRFHVIIKLERNMLDLSYDIAIDTNYPSFMDRFTHTHALYLFVQWHKHFTIDELKLIIAGTENEFKTKHATIIATHDLTLPSIVSDEHKFWVLQRALYGSHHTCMTLSTHSTNTPSLVDHLCLRRPPPHLLTNRHLKLSIRYFLKLTPREWYKNENQQIHKCDSTTTPYIQSVRCV